MLIGAISHQLVGTSASHVDVDLKEGLAGCLDISIIDCEASIRRDRHPLLGSSLCPFVTQASRYLSYERTRDVSGKMGYGSRHERIQSECDREVETI